MSSPRGLLRGLPLCLGPSLGLCLWLCLGLGLCTTPALAEREWEFKPTAGIEQVYNSNVVFNDDSETSSSDALRNQDDLISRVNLSLPLLRTWRKGSFLIAYNPGYERFWSVRDFDNAVHQANASISAQPSLRSSFSLSMNYLESQEQGMVRNLALDAFDPDPFISQRTKRRLFDSTIGYTQDLGTRWRVSASVNGLRSSFDQIDLDEEQQSSGTDLELEGLETEDRVGYGASLGLSLLTRAGSSYGLRFGHQEFDLDERGDGEVQSVAFTMDADIGRTGSMSLRVGGFFREFFNPFVSGTTPTPTGDPVLEEEDGLQVSFSAENTWQKLIMRVRADQRASLGGAIEGTSVNTIFGLVVASNNALVWNWNATARWALRDPTDPPEGVTTGLQPEVTTRALGASVSRSLGRYLDFSFRADYVDQTAEGVELTSDLVGDASFYSVSTGLIYYFKGKDE